MRYGLVALALAAAVAASPARADTEKRTVYINLTGPEYQALLQGWGFRAELSADEEGNPLIGSSINGVNYSVFFYGCDARQPRRCDSIGFSAGFDLNEPLTHDYMNEWNRYNRFGKAYVDDEGNAYLAMNINVDGGVTEAALRDWLAWWEIGIADYLDYIGWN
jgi:hypothetical protein